MGKKTTFKGNLCNGCHFFFFPEPQAVTKQGSSFSHGHGRAQEPHCHWMYSLRRNLAAAQGYRYLGKQANYLGVLYNLKFLNSLIDKPLEEGLAMGT